MDYFIVAVTTVAGLYFHWWLYVRTRRWMDRDLARSMAEGDAQMEQHMLDCLARAKQQRVPRRKLEEWLINEADLYRNR